MLTIHDIRGNRYVQAAVEALDGYTDAMALADTVQAVLDEPTTSPSVPAKLDPFTTGKVDEKWIAAQLARTAELARLDQRRRLLLDLRRDAQGKAEGIVTAQLDVVLTNLHEELTKLLDNASRYVEQLSGATTATEAITTDAGAAWKELDRLAIDYAVLRVGQQSLMQAAALDYSISARPAQGGEDLASDLHLSNLDALWPDWRNPNHNRVVRVDGTRPRLEPWPVDTTELLVWLVTSGAQAWVPTRQELDELRAERRRQMNPNPKKPRESGPLMNETKPSQYRRARRVASIR